ncbi:Srb2p [Saccharomyces cerevisiae YJM270]|nr:Srb2p [Saccharomyces cerevisiae YJM270]PTN14995.1 Srb2p [Saccharomyces cerevisiae]CAI6708939.1 AIS_collapsed_G0023900.mRNA.1.CDS.1 [Saccharomyces cerevisiae]
MGKSAVIFVERATPATLTELKDALSNSILSVRDPWSIDFRTYRCSIKNLPADVSKLMYSITFHHHGRQTVLIKDNSAMVTTAAAADIPPALVFNGSSTGVPESMDTILSSKLSNIWMQRQLIKGDAGETLILDGLTVRLVNLFSSTGFKGLLIELQADEAGEFETKIAGIEGHLAEIRAKDYKTSSDSLGPDTSNEICDLAYQYVRALEL